MSATEVVYFQDEDGTVPLLAWLDSLPAKAQDKCLARLVRLEMLGHELRRPEADFLRDGIHELRVSLSRDGSTACSISFTSAWLLWSHMAW